MGFDVSVKLIYGFKIVLTKAFELNLISPEILDGDDWQLIQESDCRDEIIERHVTSGTLKSLLETGEWNLYILASTQEDQNPDASYLFIYNRCDNLYNGRCPDYKTGNIDGNFPNVHDRLKQTYKLLWDTNYEIHWVLEGSW